MDALVTKPAGKRDGLLCRLDGDLAALGVFRLQMRAYLADRAVPSATAADIVLAAQEAAKNAVRASSGRTVAIALWIDHEAIWVSVQDAGKGFGPRCASPWSTHGRGLCLMYALMDEVEITQARGTRVVMHRHLSERAAP